MSKSILTRLLKQEIDNLKD
jgi:hypothetical protein